MGHWISVPTEGQLIMCINSLFRNLIIHLEEKFLFLHSKASDQTAWMCSLISASIRHIWITFSHGPANLFSVVRKREHHLIWHHRIFARLCRLLVNRIGWLWIDDRFFSFIEYGVMHSSSGAQLLHRTFSSLNIVLMFWNSSQQYINKVIVFTLSRRPSSTYVINTRTLNKKNLEGCQPWLLRLTNLDYTKYPL